MKLDRLKPWLLPAFMTLGGLAIGWLYIRHIAVSDVLHAPGTPVDDTYIHVQYAKMLAHGHPGSYVPGGGYTTGATSPLYVVLLSILYVFHLSDAAVTWATLWIGALCLGLTAWGASSVARDLTGKLHAAIAAGALVLVCGALTFHSVSGMETAFYCAWLVASLARTLRARKEPERWRLLVVMLALLPLVRPDGLIFSAIFGAAAFWPGMRRFGLRGALFRYLPIIAPTVVYYLVNRALTGEMTTSGMRLKSFTGDPWMTFGQVLQQILAQTSSRFALVFASRGTQGPPVFPVFFPWIILAALGAAIVADLRERTLRRALVAIALVVAYIALNNTKANLHGWLRYFVPLYPLVMILIVAGIEALLSWMPKAAPFGLFAQAILIFVVANHGFPAWRDYYASESLEIRNKQLALSEVIPDTVPAGEWVATIDAGAVALFGGRPILDINGLVSPHTAMYGAFAVPGRVQLLASLPDEKRPRWAALYRTSLPPALVGHEHAERRGFVLYELEYGPIDAARRPVGVTADLVLIDDVDVGDPYAERAHHYAYEPRAWNDSSRGTRDGGPLGDVIIVDAGRPVASETFQIAAHPGRDATIVLRTQGGTQPPQIDVAVNGNPAHRLSSAAAQSGRWWELSATIPAAELREQNDVSARQATPGQYPSFHWFLLQ